MEEKKIYIKVERLEGRRINKVAKDIKGNLVDMVNYKSIGFYIQPLDQIQNAVDAEMNDIDPEDMEFKITLTPVLMTEEEYNNLPEFTGY
jgi:hypothetical protein